MLKIIVFKFMIALSIAINVESSSTSSSPMKYFLNIAVLSLLLTSCGTLSQESDTNDLWAALQNSQFVDLTHAFEPGIPHHPLLPDEEREALFTHDQGFLLERYCHVGQWGTHVDPPIHFVEGARPLDKIGLDEMVLPLVVIDVHEKVESNPDYTITMEDVRAWEEKHGDIPTSSFVAMRTDWHKRWPDGDAMQNYDEGGVKHYPGWSQEVLTYLIEQKGVTAIGHEPTDTDPGIATSKDDYSLEDYVLRQDRYQIELLTNLDLVPESGAVIFATWPNVKNGSGFPARIFAAY